MGQSYTAWSDVFASSLFSGSCAFQMKGAEKF